MPDIGGRIIQLDPVIETLVELINILNQKGVLSPQQHRLKLFLRILRSTGDYLRFISVGHFSPECIFTHCDNRKLCREGSGPWFTH